MTFTESERHELYELVKNSSLGQRGADLVMSKIPTFEWSDIATKHDLALLREELHHDMAKLSGDLRGEMADRESRMMRTFVGWLIGAQGVAVAAMSAVFALT